MTEEELREHLGNLEEAVASLQCLCLAAEREEAEKLEETTERLVSHARKVREALS